MKTSTFIIGILCAIAIPFIVAGYHHTPRPTGYVSNVENSKPANVTTGQERVYNNTMNNGNSDVNTADGNSPAAENSQYPGRLEAVTAKRVGGNNVRIDGKVVSTSNYGRGWAGQVYIYLNHGSEHTLLGQGLNNPSAAGFHIIVQINPSVLQNADYSIEISSTNSSFASAETNVTSVQ